MDGGVVKVNRRKHRSAEKFLQLREKHCQVRKSDVAAHPKGRCTSIALQPARWRMPALRAASETACVNPWRAILMPNGTTGLPHSQQTHLTNSLMCIHVEGDDDAKMALLTGLMAHLVYCCIL